MVISPKKSPYHGIWIFVPMLILPSVLLTLLFYAVISGSQVQFGNELNWASAKIFGCGLGALFHLSCMIVGAFSEDYKAVKTRVKEFFSYIFILPKVAFAGYWDDLKTLGVAFWIDFAIVAGNFAIFADALMTFLKIIGK